MFNFRAPEVARFISPARKRTPILADACERSEASFALYFAEQIATDQRIIPKEIVVKTVFGDIHATVITKETQTYATSIVLESDKNQMDGVILGLAPDFEPLRTPRVELPNEVFYPASALINYHFNMRRVSPWIESDRLNYLAFLHRMFQIAELSAGVNFDKNITQYAAFMEKQIRSEKSSRKLQRLFNLR